MSTVLQDSIISVQRRGQISHLPHLDMLRGAACLGVLAQHSFILTVLPAPQSHWFKAVYKFADYGWLGVHMFLVLSGFCLFYPLARKNALDKIRVDVPNFAQRRAWRILPPYYFALIFFATALIVRQFRNGSSLMGAFAGYKDLILHILMLHNLLPATFGSINPPFWSLALECQLYVLFPLFVALAATLRLRGLLAITFLASAGWQLICRLALGPTNEWHLFATFYYALPGRCFEFAAGMAAAELMVRPRRKQVEIALLIAAALVVPALYVSQEQIHYTPLRDQLWGIIFACVVVLGRSVPANLPLLSFLFRCIGNIGIVSYSVYLVHQPLLVAASPEHFHVRITSELRFIVFVSVRALLLIAVGCVFYYLFERPFAIGSRHLGTGPAA